MLISRNRAGHDLGEFARSVFESPRAIQDFEGAFARKVGAEEAILFPYCRSAIQTILEVALPSPSRVLLPAYTCVVVPHAIQLAGHSPAFVDISAHDFNVPIENYLAHITSDVGAIVPTHLYGNRTEMETLERSFSRPLLFIEDCALSMWPAFRPRSSLVTSVSVYSLNFNKILSTLHGGVAVTHDRKLSNQIRAQRDRKFRPTSTRDRVKAIAKFFAYTYGSRPSIYAIAKKMRELPFLGQEVNTVSYDELSLPKSAALQITPFQAALGRIQLEKAEGILQRRKFIAKMYWNALKGIDGIEATSPRRISHFSHYPALVRDRDQIMFREKMLEEGVEVGSVLDYACTDLAMYRANALGSCENSSRAGREMVNLPNYPNLTDGQVETVIRAATLVLARAVRPTMAKPPGLSVAK